MAASTPISPGRPTRARQKVRREELLEAALDQFLEKGFEQATIEAIAKQVSMTKRTIYAQYEDKVALFNAAVARAIDRYAVSEEELKALDDGDLEQTLARVARLRADLVRTPDGLRLQRIVNVESYRFPGLTPDFYEASMRPVIDFLADILVRERSSGRIQVARPRLAATVFFSMTVGAPVRQIVLGQAISDEELDERIDYGVQLFLHGVSIA